MSLFKDEYEWIAIAHYNISLIMMQRKNYDECMKVRERRVQRDRMIGITLRMQLAFGAYDASTTQLYCIFSHSLTNSLTLVLSHHLFKKLIKDLNVSTLSVAIERGKDSLFHLPYKIDNISINLEIATIHECMGHKTLARNLFYESWEIVAKYRMPGATMSFDYQLGCSSFQEWYNSASTFKQLGNMYRLLSNNIMAAEMYRMAAERVLKLQTLNDVFDFSLQDWRDIPTDQQDAFLEDMLLRAECLAEVAEYDESEKYAGFIFQKRRTDVHLCGRAAKCCRRSDKSCRSDENSALIQELQAGADRMERGILLVQSQYRIRLAQVERHNLKYGIKAGFVVTSFLRMLLVRNRMVEPRCSNCPTQHINLLVQSFLEGKISIMKSGSEYLLGYIEMWFLAATTVQQCIKKWYARRKYSKFFKGIRGLERIFRGQICRKRLRKYFSKIQTKLDSNPEYDDRIHMTENEKMKIQYENIERLCSGTTCISANEAISGTIQLSAEESPLRVKSRRDRRKRMNPSTGRYEDTVNPQLSHNSSSFLLQTQHSRSQVQGPGMSQHSRSLGHLREGEEVDTQKSMIEHSKTMQADTQLPQINSFNFASPTASSASARKASIRKKSVNSSRCDNTNSNDNTNNNTARSEMSVDSSCSSSMASSKFTGKQYSSEVIKDFAARNPDDDVISFVSYLSVKDDATKQWIPFGVLPEREIVRLVQCTVLILSSPSFSMQDCKRMTFVIKKSAMDSWFRLKSLFIGGTRIGMSGLRDILNLGISHMKSLTFSHTKMTHFFGEYLGNQLISSELVQRIKTNSKLPQTIDIKTNIKLKKLYIENEFNFGDRGFNALLRCLQVNTSLEILIVRNCNVTNRGAQSCARYIGVSNSIQIINIAENLIDYEGYVTVMTAVASRGFRGSLQKVYLTQQTPGYQNHEELVQLYHRGTELGITMESDSLTAVELTGIDMMRIRDTDKEDIKHMHNVFKQILEDDRIEGEQILTNSFKKIIYL